MTEYIVLVPDRKWSNLKYFDSSIAEIYDVYDVQDVNIFFRAFRKLIYFIGCGKNKVFYGDWTKHIQDSVQFIIFDSCRPYHRLRRIFNNAKIRPIVYFWNPICKHDKIKYLKKYFTVFTYSKIDSVNYNLNYNPTFCVMPKLDTAHEIEYDGVFVGRNKSRLTKLEELYKQLYNPYFYVVKDKSEVSDLIDLKSENMNYDEYLRIIAKAKAIIEIVFVDNADFTLRTMEALFYQKKLITNNKAIVNAEFYNENNIYILNEQTSKRDIQNFMELPFIPYPQEQVNYYSVDKCVKRFNPR